MQFIAQRNQRKAKRVYKRNLETTNEMNLNLGFLDSNEKEEKTNEKNAVHSWNNTNDTHVYRNLAEKKFIVQDTVLFTADLMYAILIVPCRHRHLFSLVC